MEHIGTRLKRLRESRGLSIRQVAELIPCPASTYREWEYGRAIQGEPYAKLSEILGVSISELITGKKPRSARALEELHHTKSLLLALEKELLSLD